MGREERKKGNKKKQEPKRSASANANASEGTGKKEQQKGSAGAEKRGERIQEETNSRRRSQLQVMKQ